MNKRSNLEKLVLALVATITVLILIGASMTQIAEVTQAIFGRPPIFTASAEGPVVKSITSGAWSDPRTWAGGLPGEGKTVIITSGTLVTYGIISYETIRELTIEGSLIFSRSLSTSLDVGNVTITQGGYLEIGTRESPIPSSMTATLRLAATREGGSEVIIWGHLEIHGAPLSYTFTKLASSALKGDTTIVVADAVDWKPGDHIVVTSTSLNPMETEENTVKAVIGRQLTLAQPLKYPHDGLAPAAAEVAVLNRNVVVTSKNLNAHGVGITFGEGAQTGLSYAEFSHLGGKEKLGKYPIHFHHARQSVKGTLIEGVAVWDSHNRFLTIHDTDGITVRNSVGYKAVGHGFFLEDGNEMDNVLEHNLAILTLSGKLRPDDSRPAGFWIQNPVNTVRMNIAVAAMGSGFDVAIPEKTPDVIPFDLENLAASSWRQLRPRFLKILEFSENEAHSNRAHGVHLYRLNPVRQGGISWFKDLKLWRNGATGMTITASQANITNSLFFGNRLGNLHVEATDMTIRDSTFLGELDGATPGSHYMAAPTGAVLSGTRIAIANSFFKGHIPQRNLASADVILQPRELMLVAITISDTVLQSARTIIFAYPLNGDSYVRVTNFNRTPGDSFVLHRIDTSRGPSCTVDTMYVAVKCPIAKTATSGG